MSNFFKTLALSVYLASFVYAQDGYSYDSYSSDDASEESSAVEETSAGSENTYNVAAPMGTAATEVALESANDKIVYIAFHPLMAVLGPLVGTPNIFLSLEFPVASKMSVLARPFFSRSAVSTDYDDYSGVEFGMYAGVRNFFRKGHRGFYIDALLLYDHVSVSDDDNVSASADMVQAIALAGWKLVAGHFVLGVDGGFGVKFSVFAGDEKPESALEDLLDNPLVYDLNFYIGFCF